MTLRLAEHHASGIRTYCVGSESQPGTEYAVQHFRKPGMCRWQCSYPQFFFRCVARRRHCKHIHFVRFGSEVRPCAAPILVERENASETEEKLLQQTPRHSTAEASTRQRQEDRLPFVRPRLPGTDESTTRSSVETRRSALLSSSKRPCNTKQLSKFGHPAL